MNNNEWAEQEVLRCSDKWGKEKCKEYWDALEVYKNFPRQKDGSIDNLTLSFFDYLSRDLPLSPLEDKEEEWALLSEKGAETTIYHHKRYKYLLKYIRFDGGIYFRDTRRTFGIDMRTNGCSEVPDWMIEKAVDELFPIIMNYMPIKEPYLVYTKTFSLNKENDTVLIDHILTPHGDKTIDVSTVYVKNGNGEWYNMNNYDFFELIREGKIK